MISTYDNEGAPLKDYTYDKDNKLVGTLTYTMDKENKKGTAVYVDDKGRERVKVEFEYNDYGITHNLQIQDGKLVEHKLVTYNQDGQVAKTTYLDAGGNASRTVENSYAGKQLVSATTYNAGGMATQVTQYFYNANGMSGFVNYKPHEQIKNPQAV